MAHLIKCLKFTEKFFQPLVVTLLRFETSPDVIILNLSHLNYLSFMIYKQEWNNCLGQVPNISCPRWQVWARDVINDASPPFGGTWAKHASGRRGKISIYPSLFIMQYAENRLCLINTMSLGERRWSIQREYCWQSRSLCWMEKSHAKQSQLRGLSIIYTFVKGYDN